MLSQAATIVGGLGRHTSLSPEGTPILDVRLRTTLHCVYPQDVIEKVAYGLVKLSILFFYRRIFKVPSFQRINLVVIILIALWSFTLTFVTLFECGVHPEVQWTSPKAVQNRYCVSISHLLLWFAITDVIGDFLVLGLPIHQVWKLQMPVKRKFAVLFIFMLGTLSTAAGIVRLGLVVKASKADYGASSDTLAELTPPFVWTNLEVSIGVIAASLPTLGPLWKMFRENHTHPSRNVLPISHDAILNSKRRHMQNHPMEGYHKNPESSNESVAPLDVNMGMVQLGREEDYFARRIDPVSPV
ncbi:MAG: hypothetical protein M1820_010047 [Bogoriella megaspora]|nr:MAG: hypothetical protein M1820_010047 [Bogoriella megaspora]